MVGQRFSKQGLLSVQKTLFDFFISLPMVAIKVLFHNEHFKSEGT